ncbi:MAG: helix-turn-helix domain-containing protein [Myxococcaceae bacterium]
MKSQDLRTRRTSQAMARAQDAAIELFEEQGFDHVTVDDVAQRAGVGVASLYRWFGTKERLVLWDEYDAPLFARTELHLHEGKGPFDAILLSLLEGLGELYERDKKRILRRADLIASTPALINAARLDTHLLREGFSKLFAEVATDPLERELLAAVIATTLETGVEEWRRRRGRVPLDELLLRAFELLATFPRLRGAQGSQRRRARKV